MNNPLDSMKARLADELPLLRERYGVATLSLFGSYVRGEAQPDSDVDILEGTQ